MNNIELIEINLGLPDCHCTNCISCEINIGLLKKLCASLLWPSSDLGIGGHPLRFNWWKDWLIYLSKLPRNIYIVDSMKVLNIEKCELIECLPNVYLSIEIENINDIEVIKNNKIKYESLLCSIANVKNLNNKIIENNNIIIEQPTGDISSDSQGFIIEYMKGKSFNGCRLSSRSIICVNVYGDVYPCVALQYDKFCLGNIFVNEEKEILNKYDIFLSGIKCVMCCQGRSFARYGVLDKDYLCTNLVN